MTAFLATFLLDVPYGLIVGFLCSAITVIYRSQYGGRVLLGRAGDTGFFNEANRFKGVSSRSCLLMFLLLGIAFIWRRLCQHPLSKRS